MANQDAVARLMAGVPEWNRWRDDLLDKNDFNAIDLSGADLSGVSLRNANLNGCIFDGANLQGTNLVGADLTAASLKSAWLAETQISETTIFLYATLTDATFAKGARLDNVNFGLAGMDRVQMPAVSASGAQFFGADLAGADLSGADLKLANFIEANLSHADLSGADLTKAIMVETVLQGARLDGCRVYGVSAWECRLERAEQRGLVVTPPGQQEITVDDLELAQFIYMLLSNRSVRRVIDTITSKVVLILGSFSAERKPILDALRDALRHANYTPVVFDFEKPTSRDMTETVLTLAHMARFVLADITDAKSVRQELQAIVPNLPSLAVQPLILAGQEEFAMFDHFRNFRSMLEPVRYESQDTLIASLGTTLIPNVEAAVKALRS